MKYKVQGGIKEAAKLLSGLTASNRQKVLQIIAKEDAAMAEMLQKQMISIEDLKFLTVNMLRELLKEIPISVLGTAMRISSVELREYITSHISKNMAQELQEILIGPPVAKLKVNEASDMVLNILRRKIDKGEIVLSKDQDDQLV